MRQPIANDLNPCFDPPLVTRSNLAYPPLLPACVTPAGDEVIALDSILARVRGDLDLDALLPPFLCETVEGAETVTWDDQRFTCSTT